MVIFIRNKFILLYLLGVALWVPLTNIFGQSNTFVKTLRLYDQSRQETGRSIFAHKDALYINTATKCHSTSCAWYARIDENGNVQWKRGHLWTQSGNSNTFSYNNGILYIGSHSNTLDPYYHLININPLNGDSIRHSLYDFTESSPTGVAINGVVIHNDDILLYGERVRSRGNGLGIIQWVDFNGNAHKQKFYPVSPDNLLGVERVEDLQPDSTGNLVYISQSESSSRTYSIIRKVDPNGEIIREIKLEAGSRRGFPIMTVDTRGQYIIEQRIRIDLAPYIQLLCVDTLGNTVWEYNLLDRSAGPERPERYDYHKIKGTADGGVVAVGIVQSYKLQKNYYEDALILKLDKFGTKEWERRVNFMDENDTLLNVCGLIDVVQTEDGGYAAVGFNKYSHESALQEVLLVRLDKDGCVAGYDCSKDTIIVRPTSVNVMDTYHELMSIEAYPNPFSDHLTLSGMPFNVQNVYIYDVMGNIVYKNTTDTHVDRLDVDTSSWPLGLYVLINKDNFNNSIYYKKLMKY